MFVVAKLPPTKARILLPSVQDHALALGGGVACLHAGRIAAPWTRHTAPTALPRSVLWRACAGQGKVKAPRQRQGTEWCEGVAKGIWRSSAASSASSACSSSGAERHRRRRQPAARGRRPRPRQAGVGDAAATGPGADRGRAAAARDERGRRGAAGRARRVQAPVRRGRRRLARLGRPREAAGTRAFLLGGDSTVKGQGVAPVAPQLATLAAQGWLSQATPGSTTHSALAAQPLSAQRKQAAVPP